MRVYAAMDSVAVLRVKRKRGEDRVPVLVAESESKRRRVWKLSGQGDAAAGAQEAAVEPPRFNVLKRRLDDDEQVVLELGRVRTEAPALQDAATQADAHAQVDGLEAAHLDMLNDVLDDRVDSDDEWVYDTYYPVATIDALAEAEAALRSNYGLLEHFDVEQLVIEEEDDEDEAHDSEDSNAESYAGNDYPDEDEYAYSDDSAHSWSDDDRYGDGDEDDDF